MCQNQIVTIEYLSKFHCPANRISCACTTRVCARLVDFFYIFLYYAHFSIESHILYRNEGVVSLRPIVNFHLHFRILLLLLHLKIPTCSRYWFEKFTELLTWHTLSFIFQFIAKLIRCLGLFAVLLFFQIFFLLLLLFSFLLYLLYLHCFCYYRTFCMRLATVYAYSKLPKWFDNSFLFFISLAFPSTSYNFRFYFQPANVAVQIYVIIWKCWWVPTYLEAFELQHTDYIATIFIDFFINDFLCHFEIWLWNWSLVSSQKQMLMENKIHFIIEEFYVNLNMMPFTRNTCAKSLLKCACKMCK